RNVVNRLIRAERVWSIPASQVEEGELADYGLEPPRRKITISTDGEQAGQTVVRIGKPTGAADSAYALVEQTGGVCAIAQSAAEATDVSLTELRSKRLAERISTMDLEKVTVAASATADGEGFEVECARAGETWEIVRPFHDLADAAELRGLAEELYGHRIEETDFVADSPLQLAAYGLDEPDLTLGLSDGERTQNLVFARRTQGEATACYAMNRAEPSVISVPEELLTGLRKGPGDLRSRELVSLKPPDVASLTVAGPEQEVVVQKQEGSWQLKGEPPAPADQDLMERLLHDLRDARVPEFAEDEPQDLSRYGLDAEQRRTVTLRDADGEELARVVLGAAADQTHAYALRPGYSPVLLVNKERFYEPLAAGRLGLADRTVLSEPPEQAVAISLHLEGGDFRCTRTEEDGWRLVRPVEGPADESAVRRMLGAFSDLRAARYIAEDAEDLARYGLEEPPNRLTVTYRAPGQAEAESQRKRTLLVGTATDADPAERYAMLEGASRVFALPEHRTDVLTRPPASRTVCAAPALVAFTLTDAAQTIRFEYDEGQDAWTRADGEPLSAELREKVSSAAALLRSFQAVRVADYVKRDQATYGFDAPYLSVELDEEKTTGKRVVIGKPTDGGRYAAGPAVPWVLEVSSEQADRLTSLLREPE
ncbi:MAG: DUF4340 domain-containing protein, partial [Candidatus Brocadiia bacterium]